MEFVWPENLRAVRVTDPFEDRVIPVHGDRFGDAFPGYGRRVYAIETGPAAD